MTITLYGAVKNRGLLPASELGRRLGQLAFCCRGLELAVEEFCENREGEAARRLARLAADVAKQSERLAGALDAELREPLD